MITMLDPVRLGDLSTGPVLRRRQPGPVAGTELAERIGVEAIAELEAELDVRRWLDGCEVRGWFRAEVTQVCGVTLEPFPQTLRGRVELRLAPPGSPNLPSEGAGEVEIDLESPDPPEPLEGDQVDLEAILVEHLALAVDPFPRRPDAVFEWSPGLDETSPFSALRGLNFPGFVMSEVFLCMASGALYPERFGK